MSKPNLLGTNSRDTKTKTACQTKLRKLELAGRTRAKLSGHLAHSRQTLRLPDISCQLLSELLNALTVECETRSCPVHSVPSKILCTQVSRQQTDALYSVQHMARRLPDLPTLRRSFRSRKVSAVQTSMLPMHPASALQEAADAFPCGQLHIA